MKKILLTSTIFFFAFSGTALADIEEFFTTTPVNDQQGNALTDVSHAMEQNVSCAEIGDGLIKEIKMKIDSSPASSNDIVLEVTGDNGITGTVVAEIPSASQFGVRTFGENQITSGHDNFGQCIGTDMTFKLIYKAGNTGTLFPYGDDADTYVYSDCVGTSLSCSPVTDLWVQISGSFFVRVGTGIYFFGESNPEDNASGETVSLLGGNVRSAINSIWPVTLVSLGVFLSFYVLQKIISLFGYAYYKDRPRKKKL